MDHGCIKAGSIFVAYLGRCIINYTEDYFRVELGLRNERQLVIKGCFYYTAKKTHVINILNPHLFSLSKFSNLSDFFSLVLFELTVRKVILRLFFMNIAINFSNPSLSCYFLFQASFLLYNQTLPSFSKFCPH